MPEKDMVYTWKTHVCLNMWKTCLNNAYFTHEKHMFVQTCEKHVKNTHVFHMFEQKCVILCVAQLPGNIRACRVA